MRFYSSLHLDPTYPAAIIEVAKRFLEDPTLKDDPALYSRTLNEVKMEVSLIINDSPYVEVRGNVPNTDDPNTLVNTARAWTIGLFLAMAGGLINQFFSLRQPNIVRGINPIYVLMLTYLAFRVLMKLLHNCWLILWARHGRDSCPHEYSGHLVMSGVLTQAHSLTRVSL